MAFTTETENLLCALTKLYTGVSFFVDFYRL